MDYVNSSKTIIDVSNIGFFNPTMLLLLLNHRIERKLPIRVNRSTADYVKRVLGILPNTDTTLPFKKLPKERDTVNGDARNLVNLLDESYCGKRVLYHFLNEMITNMYEHSEFEKAYTLSQLYPRMGLTEISFFDNGITIPGSFKNAGLEFDNDREALIECINGQSTIDDPERGLGINSTVRLVTKGNGGKILIASGNAMAYLTKNMQIFKQVDDEYYINGTLISIRAYQNIVPNYTEYVYSKEKIT